MSSHRTEKMREEDWNMDSLRIEDVSVTLDRLVSAFQSVLYQEDDYFMENMKTHSLQNDDISRYRFWEWTQGVGLFGLWKLYEATGDGAYLTMLAKFYDERLAEGLPGKNVNTTAPMLALSFVYERTQNPAYVGVIREWAEFLMDGLPRTEEGGFQHITSDTENRGELWDDTLYMAVLFLANAGRIMENEAWQQEAAYQFLVHIKYLADRENGLWYHGWTFEGNHNFVGAHWGRGNAWVTAVIPEYLRIAQPEPALKRFLVEAYKAQARTLVKLQDGQGMWHTLLDDPDSYQEASATCGIGYGLMAGVAMGLLDETYRDSAQRAVAPILALVDEAGVLQQVSYGTPMGRESLDFYKQIKIMPMPYGQAMAMLFLIEVLKENGGLSARTETA